MFKMSKSACCCCIKCKELLSELIIINNRDSWRVNIRIFSSYLAVVLFSRSWIFRLANPPFLNREKEKARHSCTKKNYFGNRKIHQTLAKCHKPSLPHLKFVTTITTAGCVNYFSQV